MLKKILLVCAFCFAGLQVIVGMEKVSTCLACEEEQELSSPGLFVCDENEKLCEKQR